MYARCPNIAVPRAARQRRSTRARQCAKGFASAVAAQPPAVHGAPANTSGSSRPMCTDAMYLRARQPARERRRERTHRAAIARCGAPHEARLALLRRVVPRQRAQRRHNEHDAAQRGGQRHQRLRSWHRHAVVQAERGSAYQRAAVDVHHAGDGHAAPLGAAAVHTSREERAEGCKVGALRFCGSRCACASSAAPFPAPPRWRRWRRCRCWRTLRGALARPVLAAHAPPRR